MRAEGKGGRGLGDLCPGSWVTWYHPLRGKIRRMVTDVQRVEGGGDVLGFKWEKFEVPFSVKRILFTNRLIPNITSVGLPHRDEHTLKYIRLGQR